MLHYFCEDELSDGLISAGLASGALKPWRRDGEGRQWFEQVNPSGLPMIHGVPKSRDVIEADDELDDIAQLDNARALRVYSKLVDARALGRNIDHKLGDAILAACGKTMDNFCDDVSALVQLFDETGVLDE